MGTLPSKKLADLAAKGADNKKAENIEIIDVRKFSSICNYFVICSAESQPQVTAIADGIDEILIKNKIKPVPWQGKKDSDWMIQDLISVVVHVMGKKERGKYNLEELWGKRGIVYHV